MARFFWIPPLRDPARKKRAEGKTGSLRSE